MPRRRAAPSAACVSARTTCSRARAPAAASRGGRIAACARERKSSATSARRNRRRAFDVAAACAAHGRAAALGARDVGRRERRGAGYRADSVRMRPRARRSRPSCNCRASERTTRARRHTAGSWRRAKAGVGSAATGGRGHRENSSTARSRASFSRRARRSRAPSVPDATCRARRPDRKPGRRCGAQDPGESGSCAGWGAVGPGRRVLAGLVTAVRIVSLIRPICFIEGHSAAPHGRAPATVRPPPPAAESSIAPPAGAAPPSDSARSLCRLRRTCARSQGLGTGW